MWGYKSCTLIILLPYQSLHFCKRKNNLFLKIKKKKEKKIPVNLQFEVEIPDLKVEL